MTRATQERLALVETEAHKTVGPRFFGRTESFSTDGGGSASVFIYDDLKGVLRILLPRLPIYPRPGCCSATATPQQHFAKERLGRVAVGQSLRYRSQTGRSQGDPYNQPT